jgi:hypothetical protein
VFAEPSSPSGAVVPFSAPEPTASVRADSTMGILRALSLAGAVLAGCTPSIGDRCQSSTDCSVQGDRQCDLAAPGGYCTVVGCLGNACPGSAACVVFFPAVPGCPYSDRSVARTARSFCMASCNNDSDCRDGYVCRDPKGAPWSALILDDRQDRNVCVARPPETSLGGDTPGSDAGVCGPGPGTRLDGGAEPDGSTGADGGDGGVDAAGDS